MFEKSIGLLGEIKNKKCVCPNCKTKPLNKHLIGGCGNKRCERIIKNASFKKRKKLSKWFLSHGNICPVCKKNSISTSSGTIRIICICRKCGTHFSL